MTLEAREEMLRRTRKEQRPPLPLTARVLRAMTGAETGIDERSPEMPAGNRSDESSDGAFDSPAHIMLGAKGSKRRSVLAGGQRRRRSVTALVKALLMGARTSRLCVEAMTQGHSADFGDAQPLAVLPNKLGCGLADV
jgi:hypothetical protein